MYIVLLICAMIYLFGIIFSYLSFRHYFQKNPERLHLEFTGIILIFIPIFNIIIGCTTLLDSINDKRSVGSKFFRFKDDYNNHKIRHIWE